MIFHCCSFKVKYRNTSDQLAPFFLYCDKMYDVNSDGENDELNALSSTTSSTIVQKVKVNPNFMYAYTTTNNNVPPVVGHGANEPGTPVVSKGYPYKKATNAREQKGTKQEATSSNASGSGGGGGGGGSKKGPNVKLEGGRGGGPPLKNEYNSDGDDNIDGDDQQQQQQQQQQHRANKKRLRSFEGIEEMRNALKRKMLREVSIMLSKQGEPWFQFANLYCSTTGGNVSADDLVKIYPYEFYNTSLWDEPKRIPTNVSAVSNFFSGNYGSGNGNSGGGNGMMDMPDPDFEDNEDITGAAGGESTLLLGGNSDRLFRALFGNSGIPETVINDIRTYVRAKSAKIVNEMRARDGRKRSDSADQRISDSALHEALYMDMDEIFFGNTWYDHAGQTKQRYPMSRDAAFDGKSRWDYGTEDTIHISSESEDNDGDGDNIIQKGKKKEKTTTTSTPPTLPARFRNATEEMKTRAFTNVYNNDYGGLHSFKASSIIGMMFLKPDFRGAIINSTNEINTLCCKSFTVLELIKSPEINSMFARLICLNTSPSNADLSNKSGMFKKPQMFNNDGAPSVFIERGGKTHYVSGENNNNKIGALEYFKRVFRASRFESKNYLRKLTLEHDGSDFGGGGGRGGRNLGGRDEEYQHQQQQQQQQESILYFVGYDWDPNSHMAPPTFTEVQKRKLANTDARNRGVGRGGGGGGGGRRRFDYGGKSSSSSSSEEDYRQIYNQPKKKRKLWNGISFM